MNRRQALKHGASAAALFGLSSQQGANAGTPIADNNLFEKNPERYWARIREEQFLLPGWRAFLNNGSLGVAPKPVVNAVTEYLNRSAGLLLEEYPRWGYETLDDYRSEMAQFLGCKKDELAFMHNATEAMSTIAGGLDLKPGDEVLLTDQEHPSGRSCWLQKQARHHIQVRDVKIPLPPKSPGQLADLLISAIGPRTRVLSFSGITSPTGLILPVREICAAARAKGVITVVDGAHINGQFPARLAELGCDYYAGSPHKWLFAPAGCGILYVREEMLDRLWANTVTGKWDDKEIKAARFMMVGTNNRAIFEGMMAGLRFAREIGHDRIYARIHQLARIAYAKAKAIPYIEFLTPEDDRMYAGLVTIQFKDRDLTPLWDACKRKRIWTTGSEKLRLSTHIHTRPADLDLFFQTVEETLGGKRG
jgi:isopenicillin-N epimerase